MFLSSVYLIRNCKYEKDEEYEEPEIKEKSDEQELFEQDCYERARDMQDYLR